MDTMVLTGSGTSQISTEIRLGARRGGTRRTRPAPIHQRRRAVHPDDLTTPLPSFPAATWSGAGRPASRSFVRGALHLDPGPSGTTNQRLRGSRGEKVHPAPQSDGHHGLDGVGDLTDKGLVLPNGSGSLITGVVASSFAVRSMTSTVAARIAETSASSTGMRMASGWSA